MLLEASVNTKIKKEISLPHFCKYGNHVFIKVVDEKTIVKVETYDFSTAITIGGVQSFTTIIARSEPCSEDEYEATRQSVLLQLLNAA